MPLKAIQSRLALVLAGLCIAITFAPNSLGRDGIRSIQLPDPPARVHRVPGLISKLGGQIHALSELRTGRQSGRQQGLAARINYRTVICRLYEMGLHDHLRADRDEAVLEADILRPGVADFDRLVHKLVRRHGHGKGYRLAAWKAILAFNQLAARPRKTPARTFGRRDEPVSAFLQRKLFCLTDMHTWRNVIKPGRFYPWPEPIPDGRYYRKNFVPIKPTPTVSQTLQALKTADVDPAMRTAMVHALAGIRAAMSNIGGAKWEAAAKRYAILLEFLRAASQLNGWPAVRKEAVAWLNHRLLEGLLRCRDYRELRSSRGIEAILAVAKTLRRLDKSSLPGCVKRALGIQVRASIARLERGPARGGGRNMPHSINEFIGAYGWYRQGAGSPIPAFLKPSLRRIDAMGKIILANVVVDSRQPMTAGELDALSGQLNAVTANLAIISEMAFDLSDSRKFHPHPADGVRREIVGWAAELAQHPRLGSAAFDRLQGIMEALDRCEGAVPSEIPGKLLRKLSRGRYGRLVRAYRRNHRMLANMMSSGQGSPSIYIRVLDREREILLATAALGKIESNPAELETLNYWACWQMSAPAQRQLMHTLNRGLGREYQRATHARIAGKNAAFHPKGLTEFKAPAVAFGVVGPAARKLGAIYVEIGGQLHGQEHSWSASFARALDPPLPEIPRPSDLATNALICRYLDSAAFNDLHGRPKIGRWLFMKGLAALANARVLPFNNIIIHVRYPRGH